MAKILIEINKETREFEIEDSLAKYIIENLEYENRSVSEKMLEMLANMEQERMFNA